MGFLQVNGLTLLSTAYQSYLSVPCSYILFSCTLAQHAYMLKRTLLYFFNFTPKYA